MGTAASLTANTNVNKLIHSLPYIKLSSGVGLYVTENVSQSQAELTSIQYLKVNERYS